MAVDFFFFLLAVGAIVGALGMLMSSNPVSSALWLISVLFCVAGLYLTLGAQFISVVQVLVYAGAIMVLFLFVIMLLNLSALPKLENFSWSLAGAYIVGVAIMATLTYVIASSVDRPSVSPSYTNGRMSTGTAQEIAGELFTKFAVPLEMIGILLLAATIGAVMLAKRRFV